VDLFGYAATAWAQPTVYSETDIFRPTPVRDTGNQFVDDLWAGTDSVINFGKYLVNGVVGIASTPTIAYAKYNDISVQAADEEIVGYMASSGPLAPYLMTGSLPFRAGSTLGYSARALRAESKAAKASIIAITSEGRFGLQKAKKIIGNKAQDLAEAYRSSRFADETGSIQMGPKKSRKWKYNEGWDYRRVQKEVLKVEKGKRPDPSTYLKKEYMDAHRAMFENGVARIQPSAPSGKIGRTETWVIPQKTAQEAINKSKGDPRKIENLLGFDKGYLGNSPVLIDIPKPTGYRIPSGNEFAAYDDFWRPGGYTYPGKLPEAVIDPVLPDNYVVKKIYKGN
jgi:hypothetical protein